MKSTVYGQNLDVGEPRTVAERSPHYITGFGEYTGIVSSLAFSPDGRTLASGGYEDGNVKVKLWDIATKRNIATFDHGKTNVRYPPSAVSFSPDGKTLASGRTGGVQLWDLTTKRNIATFKHEQDNVRYAVYSVSFSPDGKTLASIGYDSKVKLWNIATKHNIATLVYEGPYIAWSVLFSPDGKTLAFSTGSPKGTVKLWDMTTSRIVATFGELGSHVSSVSFSPDGKTLAASGSGTVKLWDITTRRIMWYDSIGDHVLLSPDGKTLATSDSGTVKLWDIATGFHFASLPHTSPVSSMAFSPDGSTLVSGTLDGRVELWNLPSSREPEVVFIPDANLAAVIRQEIGNSIMTHTMLSLRHLDAANSGIKNLTGLEHARNLKELRLDHNAISDISVLSELTQLTSLNLERNLISDISPLEGLTRLTQLELSRNAISDVSALAGLTQLTNLWLASNTVSDVSPLVGLNLAGTRLLPIGLTLDRNPLNYASRHTYIPEMQAKGIKVQFNTRTYPALDIISGAGQQAPPGETLAEPLVVASIDAHGNPMQGVSVTFREIQGDGTLSTTTAITDAQGRAQTTLTLGSKIGINNIQARAATLKGYVTFFAIATMSAPVATLAEDVNADSIVNIQDLVMVASQLGQKEKKSADVNADGAINVQDLVLVASALGTDAAAPAAWYRTASGVPSRKTVEQWLVEAHRLSPTDARSQRGILLLEHLLAALIPEETALLTNYPNPFNPETWIPYQLAESAAVTLHIYSVMGELVRTLALGHQPAGIYHGKSRAAYWDGRNQQGERVASGIYFYTLSAGDFTATQKMLIRK